MKRRFTILCCLCLAAVLVLSCTQNQGLDQEHARPNIIMVMCDDLGWGDTGFNGNELIRTPNMDNLAGMGITFNRFYSASAVCSPTRASCLTGRNPYRLGIPHANTGHLKTEEITLPELLKEQGYATGHFGKWHLGSMTTKIKDSNRGTPGDSTHYSIPSMHGYDTWFVTESKVPTYDPMIRPAALDTALGESMRYGWQAAADKSSVVPYGTHYWTGEEEYETENLDGDDAMLILDRALPFMRKSIDDGHPFFSVIWIHTPHLPVVADAEMMAEYSAYSHREQIYYATISGMDAQLGRLWEKLEEWGQAENTMLWFCSDNGPENDTPGTSGPFRERKRSLYEGGVRVPAFCVYPEGIDAGQVSDFPCFTSDYLPTIVEMLDLDYPEERPVDGVSLTSVLAGKKTLREKPMGFQFSGKMSWVNMEYKLISTDKGQTWELYHLLEDPSETRDIITEHPDLARKMKAELLAWVESCKQSEQGVDYTP